MTSLAYLADQVAGVVNGDPHAHCRLFGHDQVGCWHHPDGTIITTADDPTFADTYVDLPAFAEKVGADHWQNTPWGRQLGAGNVCRRCKRLWK